MSDAKRKHAIPAKLVYARNKNKLKEYIVLLSTDVSLTEEEIIRVYGKHWDIEVFFKTCKSFLRLEHECSPRSYNAMTVYTPVVFARYVMLALLEDRTHRDDRFLGVLLYVASDAFPDIQFAEAFFAFDEGAPCAVVECLFLPEKR